MILIIAYIAILLFIIRSLLIFIGARKTKRKSVEDLQLDYQPFVSIIVPARNEENNIENAITCISKSNYPIDNYEIIAVNDRSKDNTLKILDKLALSIPNLKIINISEANKNNNLRGKPGALDYGINISKGELILMTDADCEVNPKWISTIVKYFSNPKVNIVSAYTTLKGDRIFDKIQAVQWVYLHKMASAGPAFNYPLGCFGTNLAIRRNIYKEIGGYSKIPFSITEDYALLKTIMKMGGIATYITNPDAVVETNPCKSFPDLVSQLRRWGRGGLDLKWVAFFFVLSSVAVWSALLATLFSGQYLLFLILLTVRLVSDSILISQALIGIGKSNIVKWTLPAVAFFLIMELLIPPLVFKSNIKWKDQIFK